MKKSDLIAASAALLTAFALAGCAGGNEPAPVSQSSDAATVSATEAAQPKAADESSTETDIVGTATFASTTDVANEVDRAIYKAQVSVPDGWYLTTDSNEGKFYSSAHGTLMIKAQNFGADAELQPLDVFADSVAASIKMNNMFYQADTEFGDPQQLTVAGLPAVRYDYKVTAYVFVNEDGTPISEAPADGSKPQTKKEVYGEYKDQLYVLYNGTDAYILLFESTADDYESAKADFDKLRDSFTISADGTKGYEAASVFMESQSELQQSYNESIRESMLAEQPAD
ncbi:MAG: hypothetical protein K6C13_09550 [Oscillospiraceae bacterium]|nr:hypothetical protein [Oscillospiraceae bacterium]